MTLLLTFLACVSGEGAFQLSTGAVDLGLIDTSLTPTVEYTIEIQNAGDGVLDVVGAEIISTDGLDISLDHGLPLALEPGELSEFTVFVTPTRRGISDATIRIFAGDLVNPSRDLLLHADALAPFAVLDGEPNLDYNANCNQGWDGEVTNMGDRQLVVDSLVGTSALGNVTVSGLLAGTVLLPGETVEIHFDVPESWYDDTDINLVLTTNDAFIPEVEFMVETVCGSNWVGMIFYQVSGLVDLLMVADLSYSGSQTDYVAILRAEMQEYIEQIQSSGLDVRIGLTLDNTGTMAWTDIVGDSETLAAEIETWFANAELVQPGFRPFERAEKALDGNPDFRREDSSLMIVMLDDTVEEEDDEASGYASGYAEGWSLSVGVWETLRIHGLVPDENCADSTGGDTLAAGIETTGGIAGGLCDSSYVAWFQEILDQHVAPQRFISLPADPFMDSMRARMNSILVPIENLDYTDPILSVDETIEWGPGDYLDIKYVVDKQCLPDQEDEE
jgi:hypothetical protein